MRVLAAMSGGVDSAVAAARMVVGRPRRRRSPPRAEPQPAVVPHGCPRLLHGRGRTRRPARGRRAGYSLLRLGHGRRVPGRRRRRLRRRVRRRADARTPACAATRRSSSPPSPTGRSRSASTPCAPATTRASWHGRSGRELHRAVDPAKDQSYVLGVLTVGQLAHAAFPLGDSLKTDVRAEAAERGLAVADKPDSHDICFIADGDTGGFLAEPDRRPAGRHRRRARRGGPGAARGHAPVHGRSAPRPRPAAAGSRRAPTVRAVDRAGGRHGDRRAHASGWPSTRSPPAAAAMVRAGTRRHDRGRRRSCGHTAGPGPLSPGCRDRCCTCGSPIRPTRSRRGRPWCSTTARGWSGRRRWTPPSPVAAP